MQNTISMMSPSCTQIAGQSVLVIQTVQTPCNLTSLVSQAQTPLHLMLQPRNYLSHRIPHSWWPLWVSATSTLEEEETRKITKTFRTISPWLSLHAHRSRFLVGAVGRQTATIRRITSLTAQALVPGRRFQTGQRSLELRQLVLLSHTISLIQLEIRSLYPQRPTLGLGLKPQANLMERLSTLLKLSSSRSKLVRVWSSWPPTWSHWKSPNVSEIPWAQR